MTIGITAEHLVLIVIGVMVVAGLWQARRFGALALLFFVGLGVYVNLHPTDQTAIALFRLMAAFAPVVITLWAIWRFMLSPLLGLDRRRPDECESCRERRR